MIQDDWTVMGVDRGLSDQEGHGLCEMGNEAGGGDTTACGGVGDEKSLLGARSSAGCCTAL